MTRTVLSGELEQVRFDARAEAALDEFKRTGQAVPAEEVLRMLQERLDARRRELLIRH